MPPELALDIYLREQEEPNTVIELIRRRNDGLFALKWGVDEDTYIRWLARTRRQAAVNGNGSIEQEVIDGQLISAS